MKVVINDCYGGFGLSPQAIKRLAELNAKTGRDIERNDPKLIQVIEELGEMAYGSFAKLKIIEIPDDIEWEIEEYDGNEWVSEKHRRWM